MPHPDQYFVDALLAGDKHVIDEIYQRSAHRITQWVMHNSGDAADAQDVLQDALISIYHRAAKSPLNLTCPFEAYLLLVCKGRWLNELKKRQREAVTKTEHTVFITEEESDATTLAEETLLSERRRQIYETQMEALGDTCQKILSLVLPQKMHMEDVAAQMGVSYGYARKKKRECITKLLHLIRNDKNFDELQF